MTHDQRLELADHGGIVDICQLAQDQVINVLSDEPDRTVPQQELGTTRVSAAEDPGIRSFLSITLVRLVDPPVG